MIVCIESWTSDEEQVYSMIMSLTSDPREAVSSNINLINYMSGFAIQKFFWAQFQMVKN